MMGVALIVPGGQGDHSGQVVSPNGVQFPATQVPSADPNQLDDYEEGTWTPVLDFETTGNLAVAYALQSGTYTKVGREVTVSANIVTSTFTHTTASGAALITGLPFTCINVVVPFTGAVQWSGITKAGYTEVTVFVQYNDTFAVLAASGSGQGLDTVNAANMPSGGTVIIGFTVTYTT